MPGIVGILGPGRADERARELRTMMESLHRETFYVQGTLVCPEMHVWAGWSAHRDSLAAELSGCRIGSAVRVAFAGEIFDDRTGMSPSVESRLAQFVAEWRRDPESALAALNGLFSGLIVDPETDTIALFNDRYGAERVYVHRTADCLYFATEAKSLLAVSSQCRAFDAAGVASYLRFGSVPGPATLFSGVEILPGASLVTRKFGSALVERRYFEPSQWEAASTLAPDQFVEELAGKLRARVPMYATAHDQPVGVAVTGGLDTRMILAALPTSLPQTACYTFAGASGETIDERLGRRVAAARGLGHTTLRIGADFLERFGEFVDRTIVVSDATAGATSAHEVYLTSLARGIAPIRLTGNYGSEVLRGMSTVKARPMDWSLIDPAIRELATRRYGPDHRHPVTSAAFAEVPWHLHGTLAAGKSQLLFRTPYLDNEIVALAYRAPSSARADGSASLQATARLAPELARIPTDRGLAEPGGFLRRFPQRLYAAVTFKLDYLDKEGLPGSLRTAEPLLRMLRGTPLLGGHKYLEYRSWFRHDLAGYVREVVQGSGVRRLGYWNSEALSRLAEAHVEGRKNGLLDLSSMLTLEAAQRLLIDAHGRRHDSASTTVLS